MKSYTILISHASDVKKELDSIEKSIKRFNDLFSEFLKVTLITCKWEDNMCPVNAYTRPQEGVNEQLVNSSDMCIAIFRTRFGSPRGGMNKARGPYGSGTEEEIALISEQGKPVLVYFLDEECINMKSLDMEQYEKLKKFKESYETKYMYSLYNDEEDTYKTESDLEYQVFNHLCNYFIKDKEYIKSNINDALYLNLIGSFSKDNPNDKEVLKRFLQYSDDQFLALIDRIEMDINSKNDKSMYRKNNNDITITNRIHFWRQNGCRYNDKTIFERFLELAQQVLFNTNIYSLCLVKGICETLALMQNQSDVFCNIKSKNRIINIANNAVYLLFFDYNSEDKCMATFEHWIGNRHTDNLLSILAEAAPEIFLKAVDTANKYSNFKYDIQLLRAMERLAWDNRYLVHVCATLNDLSNHDSVGIIGNVDSPIHSIKTILTCVFVFDDEMQKIRDEKQITAINYIKTHNPDSAVSILKDLVFKNGFMYITTDRNGKTVPSTFPEFSKLEIQYKYPNYNRTKNAYIELVLDFSKENFICLKMLIDNLDNCSEPLIYKILELLDNDLVVNLEDYKQYEIWGLLKSFIAKNRYFINTEWAKCDECIRKIEDNLTKITPQNKLYRAAWYFLNHDITEGPWKESNYDYKAEEKVRLGLRVQQLNELIETDCLASVVDLYEFCKKEKDFDIYSFAYTLSTLNNKELDEILFDNYLLSNDDSKFISSYIGNRFVNEERALCFLDNCKKWSQMQICTFMSSLSFNINGEYLTALITEDKYIKSYWQNINVITSDEKVLKTYLSNDRYELLLSCFHFYENDIETSLIIEALTKILQSDVLSVNSWSVLYQIEKIMDNQKVSSKVKEELEWLYLKFYNPYGQSFMPKHLFDKLNGQKNYLYKIINEAYNLSSQFKKGQAVYLLWLWHPDFGSISDFHLWY